MRSLELYKLIPGYPGYAVSTWGNVSNTETGCILKTQETKKGYLRVDLFDEDGNRKHWKVHRLVAMAFIPNPDEKQQVNHIDGNKKNNSVSNLEWVTDEENKDKQKLLLEAKLDFERSNT